MGTIELIFASSNPDKKKEFEDILGEAFKILSLSDIEFKLPLPEESGKTYVENAHLKAEFVGLHTQRLCFADDSGLEVEALNNEPGIHSARYEGLSRPEDLRQRILQKLGAEPNRKARFVCVIALYLPQELSCMSFSGKVDGALTTEESGAKGFGYDPLFVPDSYNRTFAELDPQEKNLISHRAHASRLMLKYLLKNQ
ncbi:MAG: non-canonical purine NTP pyrophosphatase, RdgB/HAM1 family [Deltaproteobacteria bacterium CG11_big_fil_rev_8_21_14_0_20_45_16]|nr:MAG: non-canonical purine NTP pyrophosphatase, RdgB/HAM1 family [Deltaproteobacteria bacterium CG11_big_fil_rev_8_21_14_0_20_45_16]